MDPDLSCNKLFTKDQEILKFLSQTYRPDIYKTDRGANLQVGGYFQNNAKTEVAMTYGRGRTYKKVEIIGISDAGIEDAIQQAVTKAQQSLEKLSWFEVQNVRGHIGDDGKVNEYQVVLKVAFELK
jgi:flavin-binding protein dodecin